MDKEQKRRENLYRKFRDIASRGEIPSGFDENELIDIYDFATDNYDEAVQLQVIFAAVRFFPENDELMQRRAYFLLEHMSMNDAAFSMAQSHEHENALWDLLALRVRRPEGQEAADALSEILNRFEEYDDETIIQIVTTFSELGMLNWLKDHKDEIQSRCMYKDTFLYELAQEAGNQGDFHYAVKVLDELTGMEPFNATYWHMLAQEYVNIDDYPGALSAIDYAIAIDPNSAPILTTRAQILFDMKDEKAEAYRMMQELIDREPTYTPALFTLAAMNGIDGNDEDSALILERHIAANPTDREAVEHLLKLGDSLRNLRVLRDFISSSGMTSVEWSSWARGFFERGQWQSAADIMLTHLYTKGKTDDWDMLLESLYRRGRVGEIAPLYSEYLTKIENPEDHNITIIGYLILILALVRNGQPGIATKMAENVIAADLSRIDSMEQRLKLIGAQTIIKVIAGALSMDNPADIDQLDPFIFPQDK